MAVKRKARMPDKNMGELNSAKSLKIADGPADDVWISNFYLDYAYGQVELTDEAKNMCIFAVTEGNITGYQKQFYELADIPNVFQKKTDNTLENKHPARIDDFSVVTKAS